MNAVSWIVGGGGGLGAQNCLKGPVGACELMGLRGEHKRTIQSYFLFSSLHYWHWMKLTSCSCPLNANRETRNQLQQNNSGTHLDTFFDSVVQWFLGIREFKQPGWVSNQAAGVSNILGALNNYQSCKRRRCTHDTLRNL